jgi:heat shock protein HtpX
MRRYHLIQLVRGARVSRFEEQSALTGVLLLLAGVVLAMVNGFLGGAAWLLGTAGLGALGLCALSRGVRLYRAGVAASLPESVGRVGVRIRPRRFSTTATALFAIVLPAAAVVALVALTNWGWLAIGAVLLLAYPALLLRAVEARGGELPYDEMPTRQYAPLDRLCMRADIPVPKLIVEPSLEANAWTTAGRIHLTTSLLALLDESELEAVLAHEVAHLARRDAAAMDVCSAPSRVLLTFADMLASGIKAVFRNLSDLVPFLGGVVYAMAAAAIAFPPAFLLGWTSRLSVLGMSRSREFAADAAAAALTGRPSALASALMKLDAERGWLPESDLREFRARALLCIVGSDESRLGRVFRTHPPIAARVKRLEAIEQRVQAGARAIQLD